jgi:hypothetical protein
MILEAPMKDVPFSTLNFAPAEVEIHPQQNGSTILRSPQALRPYPDHLGKVLRQWADAAPDRIFLGERAQKEGWDTLSYARVAEKANAVSQALLDRGLKGLLGEKSLAHNLARNPRITMSHCRTLSDVIRRATKAFFPFSANPTEGAWRPKTVFFLTDPRFAFYTICPR